MYRIFQYVQNIFQYVQNKILVILFQQFFKQYISFLTLKYNFLYINEMACISTFKYVECIYVYLCKITLFQVKYHTLEINKIYIQIIMNCF